MDLSTFFEIITNNITYLMQIAGQALAGVYLGLGVIIGVIIDLSIKALHYKKL